MSGGRWFRGSLRSHLNHRGTVAAALVIALVVAGVVLRRGHEGPACAPEDRVAAADVPQVFTTGPRPAGADHRLARLVDAARGWGLGHVVGALGFDYGHFLTLAALPAGLAAWTHDSPDVAFLDPSLRPGWGIAQDRGQHAWDLTAARWLQLRLPAGGPMQVTDRRLADGALRWCAPVGTRPTRYGDPLATAPLPGGDVLVLGAGRPGGLLTRLAGSDGRPRWTRTLAGARDGSTLLDFGPVVVTGGRASYDLTGTAPDLVEALDPRTGRRAWTWRGAGPVHVLGSDGSGLVLEEQVRGRLVLVALDSAGRPVWRRVMPPGSLPDATVRGGTVVVRTPSRLVGVSAGSGRPMWEVPVRARPQYFPYGFQLDAQPMLDAGHLLLGTTTALVALDLRTGRRTEHALPVHGIDTTYWPYQVVVTDALLAVVTNTGAVVLRRSGSR